MSRLIRMFEAVHRQFQQPGYDQGAGVRGNEEQAAKEVRTVFTAYIADKSGKIADDMLPVWAAGMLCR